MNHDLKPMLTPDDVAKLLGGETTAAWVREQCAAKNIPGHKIGSRWKIDQDEFKAWRERQRFVPNTLPTYEPAPVRGERGGLLLELIEEEAA